jgi:SAM-dependent methyltransferase
MSDAAWWESAFGADYLELYAHRDDQLARAEVAAVMPRLSTAPGPVLDACCGHGRHLVELRAAGLPAVGFDLSPHLLAAAARRGRCAGRIARCDMRVTSFTSGFGAVLLLFTAFGYFDDAGNADCLRSLGALLAPGGWLLLDLPDPERLRRGLVPRSSRCTPSGCEAVETRTIDGQRVVKEIAFRGRTFRESVRLYAPEEIAALAGGAGLSVIERWPSLRGPGHDDGRCVYWLRR